MSLYVVWLRICKADLNKLADGNPVAFTTLLYENPTIVSNTCSI